jgi:hypothetical protein
MPERKDFGDVLVRAALLPVHRASSRLREGEISEGLNELAKEKLLGALKDGAARSAALFRLEARDVEAMLPWDTILLALDRLEAAHVEAMRAFLQYATTVGGRLTGFAGGTVVADVRRQSAADALANVAKRFVRDKGLYDPLVALAAELSTWETLMARTGELVHASPLWGRFRRRQILLRVLVLGVVLSAIAAGVMMSLERSRIAAARERVENLVTAADPCAVEGIAGKDAKHARPDQTKRAEEKKKACEEGRARARYVAACDALAKNLEAGALSQEDLGLAKEAAPRLGRATKKLLDADDLLATERDMPCQDTDAKGRMFRTYAAAAAASTAAWAEATRISDDLRKALAAEELSGVTGYRDEIARDAEVVAAKAISSGKPEEMARAKALCEFRGSFGLHLGKQCKGLLAVMK